MASRSTRPTGTGYEPCPGQPGSGRREVGRVARVPATLMDGKALGARIRLEVAEEVAELGHVGLATVLVGDDPASDVYITLKHRAAVEAGIDARDLRLPAETSRGGGPRTRRASSTPTTRSTGSSSRSRSRLT